VSDHRLGRLAGHRLPAARAAALGEAVHVHVDLHAPRTHTRGGAADWGGLQPAEEPRAACVLVSGCAGTAGCSCGDAASWWRGYGRMGTRVALARGGRQLLSGVFGHGSVARHLVVVYHGLLVVGGLEGLIALRLELQRLGDVRLRVRGHQGSVVLCPPGSGRGATRLCTQHSR
jgi:hypothetical protein